VVTRDTTEGSPDDAFLDAPTRSIRIVLGTAGGPGSERVAAWTTELTRQLGGDLEIVAAYARRSAEEPPDVALELGERAVDSLRRWAAANRLAAIPVRAMERDPEEALALAARDRGADLVIIGSEDEEGVTSFGFGSIAHRLAHHLHCPLIVVPPGNTTIEGGVIVVCADGAPNDVALRWASHLALAIGGRVVAVSDADASHETFDLTGEDAPGDEASGKHEFVGVDGGNIELIEHRGSDAAAALREVAAELNASLIVVSAKRHHDFGGLLLGAVADHLLHRPSRPVVVLPHGYDGWPAATQTPQSPQGGSR
jgi:nucleotide-binding universal stress UspA family protein